MDFRSCQESEIKNPKKIFVGPETHAETTGRSDSASLFTPPSSRLPFGPGRRPERAKRNRTASALLHHVSRRPDAARESAAVIPPRSSRGRPSASTQSAWSARGSSEGARCGRARRRGTPTRSGSESSAVEQVLRAARIRKAPGPKIGGFRD